MRVLSFFSVLLSSVVTAALSGQSLVLPGPLTSSPVTVELNREEVDGYVAEGYVITAGDFSISGGVDRMWHLPLLKNATAATFEVGYRGYARCELRAYRAGRYAETGWESALPAYLEAAQQNPENAAVRFKADETGVVPFKLPMETVGREIHDEHGQVIFSDKRERYPTLWGSPYYVVEYELTQNPDTEAEVKLTVSEIFLHVDAMEVHLIFRAPTESHAGLYKGLLRYLEQFFKLT